MKLYDFEQAPNPRRVRIFLAEKGVEIPIVSVDLMTREQLGDDYRAINPLSEVPALELDDGTVITESTAICRYIEEIHPEPPLMGRDPVEKAQIVMWDRRIEFHGFAAIAEAFRNSSPNFENRSLTGALDYEQIPALVDRGHARTAYFFDRMNDRLGVSEFVAGDHFSIVDITAFVAVQFARWIKTGPTEAHTNTKRWLDAVGSRESVNA